MAAEKADSPQITEGDLRPGLTTDAARFTAGVVETVLDAELIRSLQERVDDNRTAVRQIIKNLYALEQRVDAFEARQERKDEQVSLLKETVEAQAAHIEDLETRLEAIEAMYTDDLLDGQYVSRDSRDADSSDVISRGETITLAVEDIRFNQRDVQAAGRSDGLVGFVDFDDFDELSTDPDDGGTIELLVLDWREMCTHMRSIEEVTLL